MDEGWERTQQPLSSRLRIVGLGLAAVLVVGLLIRPEPPPPAEPSSALEVEREPPEPTPRRTPVITRVPTEPTPPPDEEEDRPVLAGIWVDGAPLPADPFGDTTVVSDGHDRVFLVGGQRYHDVDGRITYTDEVWQYRVSADAWTALPPLPHGAHGSVAAAWTGTELIAWGGHGRTALSAEGAAYDPERGAWRPLPSGPLSPRFGAAAIHMADGGIAVIGGGDHEGRLDDGAVLGPGSSWDALPSLPAASPWAVHLTGARVGDDPLIFTRDVYGGDQDGPARLRDGAWESTVLPGFGEQRGALGWVRELGGGMSLGMRSRWSNSGMQADVVRLPPGRAEWELVAEAPLTSHEGLTGTLVAGRYVIVAALARNAMAYDLDNGRWLDLPQGGVPSIGGGGVELIPLPDGFLAMPPGRFDQAVRRFVLDADGSAEPPVDAGG